MRNQKIKTYDLLLLAADLVRKIERIEGRKVGDFKTFRSTVAAEVTKPEPKVNADKARRSRDAKTLIARGFRVNANSRKAKLSNRGDTRIKGRYLWGKAGVYAEIAPVLGPHDTLDSNKKPGEYIHVVLK